MNKVLKHILLISFMICHAVYCYFLGCPFRNIVGVPCPTCGVTHALVSLLHLDFNAYMSYNPMALPLLIIVLLAFHLKLFKHKKIITAIIVAIAIVNFFLYLKRIL